jgi:hypothetical protein
MENSAYTVDFQRKQCTIMLDDGIDPQDGFQTTSNASAQDVTIKYMTEI